MSEELKKIVNEAITTISTFNESDVIARCKAQEINAQEILYKKYAPFIFTICRRYQYDKYLAEDLHQDVFMRIFDKIKLYDPAKGTLKNWMARLTINHALNHLRRSKIDFKSLYELEIEALNAEQNELSESFFNAVSEEVILDSIAQLPIGYKTVFNMHMIDEKPHKEIAKLLNISVSTSKSQLHKAKALLRKILLTQKNNYEKLGK